MDIKGIYERQIKRLPKIEQLHLIELIAHEIAIASVQPHRRSLLEMEGKGSEIWQGVDAQAYVDEMRK